MKKSRLMLIVFVAISLLAIFAVYELNIFNFSLQPVSLARIAPAPNCITPPVYPQVITQSVTICPGIYYDGIEIAGNNIKVKCAGAIFAGYSNPNRMNGLLINGSYANITVEDCNFNIFPENGILLRGQSGMLSPGNLSKVLLKNVTAFGNVKDGLQIRENTYQIDNLGGKYDSNGENGIHLISEYKDPLRYNINPDIYPKYFPNDVRLFNVTISNNYKNGMHVDAEKYYRQLDDMERENNTIIIDGNIIRDNIENGIKNTDFFSGVFQNGLYFVRGNYILNNSLAGIKIHTKKTQGPNGNEINCTPVSSQMITSRTLAISEIDWIYLNKIEGNRNGIELIIDSKSTPNSVNSCGGFAPAYEVHSPSVYANRIRYNNKSGVLYQLTDPSSVSGSYSDFTTHIDGVYTQNIISFNGNSGVFLNGSASIPLGFGVSFYPRGAGVNLLCNDIITNNGYGVRASGKENSPLMEGAIDLTMNTFNIVERNTIGGVYSNYSTVNGIGGSWWSINNNYFDSNANFNLYNGVNITSGGVSYNDIIGSSLLAFDIRPISMPFPSIIWNRNYWSDYSPTCLDSQPDGWCDVPRPIPLASQDVQPKAGSPWGNNGRGYLQLDQGTLLSQCFVAVPPYPPRPIIPPTGGTTGTFEPYNPNGGGPGGGSPSGTPGSDGTTGGGFAKGGK